MTQYKFDNLIYESCNQGRRSAVPTLAKLYSYQTYAPPFSTKSFPVPSIQTCRTMKTYDSLKKSLKRKCTVTCPLTWSICPLKSDIHTRRSTNPFRFTPSHGLILDDQSLDPQHPDHPPDPFPVSLLLE